jgi:hypothetical protein
MHINLEKCPRCEGTGKIYWRISQRYRVAWTCPKCNGGGVLPPVEAEPLIGDEKAFWRGLLPIAIVIVVMTFLAWGIGQFNPGNESPFEHFSRWFSSLIGK